MTKYIYYKKNEEYSIFATKKEETLQLEFKKIHPEISDYIVCDAKETNFSFCYDIIDNKKIINLKKAKNITKERLRNERKILLEVEDIKFMQAQESGSDTKTIVDEKQRLRDITKQVDSCKNIDELKALNCNKPE